MADCPTAVHLPRHVKRATDVAVCRHRYQLRSTLTQRHHSHEKCRLFRAIKR